MSTSKGFSQGTCKDTRTMLARMLQLDSSQMDEAFGLLCHHVAHCCTKYIGDLQLTGQERRLVLKLGDVILEYQTSARKGEK